VTTDRRARTLPKAVLFDMDDTIFDHALTCRRALAQLWRTDSRFRSRRLEEIWREYSRLLELVQPDVASGRVTVQQARVERFRQLALYCGTGVTPEQAAGLSAAYRAQYQRLRRTVPGVRRVLERLQGRTTLGVVTNNEVAEQEEKLDHFQLRSLINFMIVSAGVGVAKPDTGIFQIALERADARPEEAVMIGDSWKSDIVGARNAGIRPVWFNRFHLPAPDPWPVRQLTSFRSPVETEAALVSDGGELPTER